MQVTEYNHTRGLRYKELEDVNGELRTICNELLHGVLPVERDRGGGTPTYNNNNDENHHEDIGNSRDVTKILNPNKKTVSEQPRSWGSYSWSAYSSIGH